MLSDTASAEADMTSVGMSRQHGHVLAYSSLDATEHDSGGEDRGPGDSSQPDLDERLCKIWWVPKPPATVPTIGPFNSNGWKLSEAAVPGKSSGSFDPCTRIVPRHMERLDGHDTKMLL